MMVLLRLLPAVVIRYLLRHKLIAIFNILSIALGVAVYLAIQIANYSANRSFNAGIDLVAGKSHLEVVANQSVDAKWYATLHKHPQVESVTPILDGFATFPEIPGEYLKIVGIDVFSNGPFATYQVESFAGAGDIDFTAWLSEARSVALMPEMLDRLGLEVGDTFDILINGVVTPVKVGGAMKTGEEGLPANTALMDIGWAQELFDSPDAVTSFQIRVVEPEKSEEIGANIQEKLPEGISVITPEVRNSQVQKMLQGFQLNLTALSMVSVLVGIYLIYNTVSASVVRRRREIGILRSLGLGSGGIRALFLGEAVVMGALGIALGIFGGIWLGNGLLSQVAQTVSMHYILLSIDQAFISPGHVFQAIAYGMVATLVGAWLPAREAATTDPAQVLSQGHLQDRQEMRTLPWFFAGIVGLLLGVWMAWQSLSTGPAWLSFGSCFLVVVGFSLLVGALSKSFARIFLKGILRIRSTGATLARVATENFRRALHRSSMTVAALMVAIAMMVGVSVMISSFRSTIGVWMNQVMVADLYIAPASQEVIGAEGFVPAGMKQDLMKLPGVAEVDSYLNTSVRVATGERYQLSVIEGGHRDNVPFVGGNDAAKMKAYFSKDQVLVSEILGDREDVSAGDILTLKTPKGDKSFTVAGVYYDYTSSSGKVTMTRENYNRYWSEKRYQSLALFYDQQGADPTQVASEVRVKYGDQGAFSIYSNQEIRQRILEIFDQTFSITYVLRSISILVAIFGIILTLTTLVMERTREIAIFRAIGASRWQVMHTYLMEAGLVGFISSLIGLVAGLALSMILTWVVNKAFFGWSIQFQIPWGDLALVPFWVTAVAVLAGLIPAVRAGNIMISEAVRSE